MCHPTTPAMETTTTVVTNQTTNIVENYSMNKVGIKRSRRVAFNHATVVGVGSMKTMDEKDRSNLWYQTEDLDQFKKDLRQTSRALKMRSSEFSLTGLHLQTGESIRGLEHRISSERQRNKLLAIRAVVKAQYKYESPDDLAVVAYKCSVWAKEIALATGYQDFYMAYNPSMVHLVAHAPTTKFPFDSRKRFARQSSCDSSCSSVGEDTLSRLRKRRRTATPEPPMLIEIK